MERIWREITALQVFSSLKDLIMPRCCIVCGTTLGMHEHNLCLQCLSDVPYTYFWDTPYNEMSDKFNERIRSITRDGEREMRVFAASLFYYNSESPYRLIPQALKYHGDIDTGRHFASILGRHLAERPEFANVDLVVPVPLHWRRFFQRGYNQAEVIANTIAGELHAPVGRGILRRKRYTQTQTRLSGRQKYENVQNAFTVRGTVHARHLLLVDDTFTTGATLAACYQALRQKLPSTVRISIATLAYVRN